MQEIEFLSGVPSRPEFGNMFGGWLVKCDAGFFMVDCGVGTGGKSLVENIKAKTDSLDYLLLTHIHLDHAGAAAELVRAFPKVKVLAHAKGIPHLINPDKLWEGTKKVMGDVAIVYGKPEPLDPQHLISHEEAVIEGLEIYETPGHAPHHLSFRLNGAYFAGEAGGCPLLIDGRLHSRPATPARFRPDITIKSIDLLLSLPESAAYFAHTAACLPFHEPLRLYKRQLNLWDSILRRPEMANKGEDMPAWLERLADVLFSEDPNLRPLNYYSAADLWRERYFMKNSIEGFLRYYAEQQVSVEKI